jgi:hypothetical protein
MHIDSYNFGHIVIDGVSYRQDLLIWPGRIKTDWWRQESHLLRLDDVTEALAANPEVLVVGKGDTGNMQVDPPLAAFLKGKGIDLVAVPTKEAGRIINSLSGKRRLAAALHLTC